MSDSNRSGISFVEEVAWGVNPGTALTNINFTSESLSFNIDNITSDSIRQDRQIADLIQTGASCAGDINFEWQYGNVDSLIQGGLWATQWVGADDGATDAVITSGTTVGNLDFTLASAGNTITLGSSVTHSLVIGQWFYLSGSTADDGHHRIVNVAGNVITVDSITGDEVLDETDLATITSSYIKNGVTENSYWIERNHADVTQFFAFAGMVVNTFAATFTANSIATGTISLIGKEATLQQATTGTGTNNAAATTNIMNCVANIGEIRIDGTAITGCLIQEINFTVNNNVRGLSRIGNLGFCDIGVGEVMVEGTLNMYFLDETYYDLYLAGTAFSLEWRVTDAAGYTYTFVLPNCKFVTDTVNATGKNSDVMENCGFQAIMDPTLLFTIMVCKYQAV